MVRLLFITLAAGLLSACTHLPDWVRLTPLSGSASQSSPLTETGQYSFAWRLSGNRQVAPLQVFDNGKQTWLQFQPDQPIPAIFQHTPQGDRPLTYQRQGPYVVLDGVWPYLLLRGGQLQSRVERVLPETMDISLMSAQIRGAGDGQAVNADISQDDLLEQSELVASQTIALTEPSFGPALLAALPQTPPENTVLLELPSSHAVSPMDKNLRSALSRWAAAAGWTFEPEHWVVDADIPIVGSATFQTGFKQAVQDLVATTELADRPLQPCFYSNRVLRIVPYAQTCDRSAGVGVS